MQCRSLWLVIIILGAVVVNGHIFSTLFTAQDVGQYLSTDTDIDTAIAWCKNHGVTNHIWIETWRGEMADKTTITKAKQRFEAAGFNVSGCVCTVSLGKPSTNWNLAACYTNTSTQLQLKSIFEFTASIFDVIIIDDFYFTDCECDECITALGNHEVNVAGHRTHFENTVDHSCYDPAQPCPWKDYRPLLMLENARWNILEASKAVNPNVSIIIKYPDWYDVFQDFGYDTSAETALFPEIWVGTEFRDYTDALKPAYDGFFNMRWLGSIGAGKTGGGWYDPFSSSPQTYLEQARMTILGGAKESFLFHYGALVSGDGATDANYLRDNLPDLQAVADKVATRNLVGVAAYKPPNSHGGCIVDPEHSNQCKGETFIFDFVGMLGIPLYPTFIFPADHPSAFFSVHSLKDPNFVLELGAYLSTGRPVLVTDQLALLIGNQVNLNRPNVYTLPVKENPPSLLINPPANLDVVRNALLKPLGLQFTAPVNTSFFPFSDGSWVVENFANANIVATINGSPVNVASRGWVSQWK